MMVPLDLQCEAAFALAPVVGQATRPRIVDVGPLRISDVPVVPTMSAIKGNRTLVTCL
jgi:hypothetical protein